MARLHPLLAAGLASVALIASTPLAFAKGEEWKDIQGNSFTGDPVEALGPFAIFSVSKTVGRRLPMQALPMSELTRFYRGVKDHPPLAPDWADAKGALTAELRGHLDKLENKQLVSVHVAGRPEPEVVVVLFINKKGWDSWKVLAKSVQPYQDLAKAFPGKVEVVMFGVGYSRWEYAKTAADQNAPWLAADLDDEDSMDILHYFIPGDGYSIVAFTRDGIPLFAAVNPDEDTVTKTWKDVAECVSLLTPANPYSWKPLAYYRTAQLLVDHPTGHLDPELVGNPIRGEVLRKHKVYDFDAKLTVTPFGSVSDVEMTKADSIPEKISEAIMAALKMAVFVPAINQGKAVEGTYAYHFHVDP